MSDYIIQLKDEQGNRQFPVTTTQCVVDETGKSLDDILSTIGSGGGGASAEEIYIGSEEPTDDKYKVWINPDENPEGSDNPGGNGNNNTSGVQDAALRVYVFPGESTSMLAENGMENLAEEMHSKNKVVYDTIIDALDNGNEISSVVFDFKYFNQLMLDIAYEGTIQAKAIESCTMKVLAFDASYQDNRVKAIIFREEDAIRDMGAVMELLATSAIRGCNDTEALNLIGGYMLNSDGSVTYSPVGSIRVTNSPDELTDREKEINRLTAHAAYYLNKSAIKVCINDFTSNDWITPIAVNRSIYWLAMYCDDDGNTWKIIMDYKTGVPTIVSVGGNGSAVIYSGTINADGTATLSDEEKSANMSIYNALMSGQVMPIVYKQDLTQVMGYARIWSNVVADVYPEYGVQIKASYAASLGTLESQNFVLNPDGTLDFDAI